MRACQLVVHRDDDAGWWADSPDAPGYFAAHDDFQGLLALAREGLGEFLEEPVDVVVSLDQVLPAFYTPAAAFNVLTQVERTQERIAFSWPNIATGHFSVA